MNLTCLAGWEANRARKEVKRMNWLTGVNVSPALCGLWTHTTSANLLARSLFYIAHYHFSLSSASVRTRAPDTIDYARPAVERVDGEASVDWLVLSQRQRDNICSKSALVWPPRARLEGGERLAYNTTGLAPPLPPFGGAAQVVARRGARALAF